MNKGIDMSERIPLGDSGEYWFEDRAGKAYLFRKGAKLAMAILEWDEARAFAAALRPMDGGSVREALSDACELIQTIEACLERYHAGLAQAPVAPPADAGWRHISTAPKDGTPFLAKVKDWYRGNNVAYKILYMTINGMWQTDEDAGAQTFDAEDIMGIQRIEAAAPAHDGKGV